MQGYTTMAWRRASPCGDEGASDEGLIVHDLLDEGGRVEHLVQCVSHSQPAGAHCSSDRRNSNLAYL